MKSISAVFIVAGLAAHLTAPAHAATPQATAAHLTSICAIAKAAPKSYGKYFRVKTEVYFDSEYHTFRDANCPDTSMSYNPREPLDPSVERFTSALNEIPITELYATGASMLIDAYVRYDKKRAFNSNNRTFVVLKIFSYERIK